MGTALVAEPLRPGATADFAERRCNNAAAPSAAVERVAADTPSPSDFRRLVENEIPFLRRVVQRWDRQPASADDLVQDTLLQALANGHLWQPGSNLRGWLVTIMRNRFLARLAKSARHAWALENGAMAETGSWMCPSETRLVLRDVERALKRLPGIQRAAMHLVAIEGKSYEDAAAALGITPGAVRCHLSRARERLRNAVYEEKDYSPCSRPAVRMPMPMPAPMPAPLSAARPPALLVGAD